MIDKTSVSQPDNELTYLPDFPASVQRIEDLRTWWAEVRTVLRRNHQILSDKIDSKTTTPPATEP